MVINESQNIWYEKYRPQRVEDLILPKEYIEKFKAFVSEPRHILLTSVTPGTGKTSTLNAIIKESGVESLFVNASLDTGVDVLRGRIHQFASTESVDGRKRIVVLDEIDNATSAMQAALRGFLEEFSVNCVFILTCNYKSKILPPIVNRCECYDFDDIFRDAQTLIPLIFERLTFILNNEKISFENADVVETIRGYYPSIREMVGVLQKSVVLKDNKKSLDLKVSKYEEFDDLFTKIQSKDFEGMTKQIQVFTNPDGFYTWLYKKIRTLKNPSQALIIIAKYQYQNAFVRDHNLNLAACCAELMNLGV